MVSVFILVSAGPKAPGESFDPPVIKSSLLLESFDSVEREESIFKSQRLFYNLFQLFLHFIRVCVLSH